MAGQLSWGSLILLLICLGSRHSSQGTMVVEDVFPEEGPSNTLYTLHYDRQTGRSAVGGVNRLTLLGPNLETLHKIKTGPTMENIECPPPWLSNCTCQDTSNSTCIPFDKIPTDSVVKTIAVDGNILIYCTSSYGGTCRKLMLNNLRDDTFLTEFVINGDIAAPLVSVVSAGPEANANFLYLGSSWSDRSRFREENWARVATLSAVNLKDYKYLQETRGSTTLFMKDDYKRQHFTVLYKYAFTYNGFNYFLSVQQKSLKSQDFESRIGRLCDRDRWFASYTEVRLACINDDQARYNILTAAHVSSPQHGFEEDDTQLFITFAQSYDKSYESLASSALCIYKMKDIEQAFTNVVKSCFSDGKLARVGPDHFADAEPCQQSNVPIDGQYCGMHNLNTPIEGSEWVWSYMQQDFQGTLLTGVTAARVKNKTVAFLGTESGSVVKVFIEYPNKAEKYDLLKLEGAAIQKDFYLTNSSEHLVILGKHKVYKIKTYSCSEQTSCSACLKARDVMCGWCLTSGKCGGLKDCEQESAWIPSWDGSCPALSSIIPREIEARNILTTKVSLAVKWLPQLAPAKFECILRYQNQELKYGANRESASTVSCDHFRNLPALLVVSGSLTFDLDLLMNGHSILETEVVIYNCGLLETCIGCTNSSLACAWCSQSHRCTYASDVDSIDQCRNENYIYSGMYTEQHKIRGNHGANQCPQLINSATSVLLPSGLPSAVQIIAKNIQSHQHKLQCVFHMADQLVLVPADIEENIEAKHFLIYCMDELLYYDEAEPLKNISVDVYWGANKTVDNPANIQVTLYKCEFLVSDCGHCLTLRETYKCGWCNNEGNRTMSSCSLVSQCPYEWLNHDQICPNPHVTRFSPLSGPLSGGTSLTINGVNLGKQISDLQNGVKVAGVRCVVQEENYLPSSSFVCITEGSHNPVSGPIAVRVANKYGTESEFKFTYVVPVVLELWPIYGPVSGGTEVTVSGQYLNTGSEVKVKLNGQEADVATVRRNTTHLVFKTPSQDGPTVATAKFAFDRAVIPSQSFKYMPDPVVESVKNVTAFYPGGGRMEVWGSNLDSVQQPKLRVYLPDTGETFTEECDGQATILYCTIPSIDHHDWNESVVVADYGLIMDGVEMLVNLSSRPDVLPLMYHPIPQIFPVNLPLKYTSDLQLVIKGIQLDALMTAAHFIVSVGGAVCNVTFVDSSTIMCVPPAQPHSVDSEGFANIVFMAGHYKQLLGVVEYAPMKSGRLAIILGVVFGVALPILLVVALLFVCLYRQNRKNKNKLRTPYKKDYIDELGAERDSMFANNSMRHRDENRPSPSVTIPLISQVSRPDLSDDEEPRSYNLHNGSALYPRSLDSNQNKADDNVSRDSEDYDSIIPPKFLQNLLANLDDDNLRQMVEEVLIPRDQLELGRVLGKGHFGRVYHGTLKTADKDVEVAVKTLQGRELDRATVESFLQEGMMMKNFDHTHVLQLLGVVISSGEYPMVILPYMSKGDLRSYVKDKNKTFTSRQLLGLAQQVAAGMAYLSKLNFVHRDLAARNCMIDDSDVVKVADFGLSKDLYDKDYYASKDRKRKMPIKWMALESLEDYIFTTKSDVWSFGVLMWELLTRGVTPYPDVDVFEVRNYLASGHRLRQPKYCPQQIYKIMLKCWAVHPADRPSFVDLVNQLEMIIRPPKSVQADPENDEPIYMNAAEAKESKPRPRVPPPPPPMHSTPLPGQSPPPPVQSSPPPVQSPPPPNQSPPPADSPSPVKVDTPPRAAKVVDPLSAEARPTSKLESPPPVPAKPALPKKPSIHR